MVQNGNRMSSFKIARERSNVREIYEFHNVWEYSIRMPTSKRDTQTTHTHTMPQWMSAWLFLSWSCIKCENFMLCCKYIVWYHVIFRWSLLFFCDPSLSLSLSFSSLVSLIHPIHIKITHPFGIVELNIEKDTDASCICKRWKTIEKPVPTRSKDTCELKFNKKYEIDI